MAGGGRHVVLCAVPAVAEYEPGRVRTGPQVPGHVVGGVEDSRPKFYGLVVVVVGGGRVEHPVADPLPVDVQLVVAQPRHVAPGPARLGIELGFCAQQGSGDALCRGDPGTLPVLGLQQGHLEGRRRAAGSRAPVTVPGLDSPPAPLATAQRCARVRDAVGGVGGNLARVPPVADAGVEARPARADQHPVGRLALAPGHGPVRRLALGPVGCLDPPAEAGSGLVEAERVGLVLALGVDRSEARAAVDGLVGVGANPGRVHVVDQVAAGDHGAAGVGQILHAGSEGVQLGADPVVAPQGNAVEADRCDPAVPGLIDGPCEVVEGPLRSGVASGRYQQRMVEAGVVSGAPGPPAGVGVLRVDAPAGEREPLGGDHPDHIGAVVEARVAERGRGGNSVLGAAPLDVCDLGAHLLSGQPRGVEVALGVVADLEPQIVQGPDLVPGHELARVALVEPEPLADEERGPEAVVAQQRGDAGEV